MRTNRPRSRATAPSTSSSLSAFSICPYGRFTFAWRPLIVAESVASSAVRMSRIRAAGGNAVAMKYSAIASSSRPESRIPYAFSTARPARPTCW